MEMDLPEGRPKDLFELGAFFLLRDWLQFWLGRVSSLVSCGILLLDFEGDGLAVQPVSLGGGSQGLAAVYLRSCGEQNDSFDDQLADSTFVGLANKSG
jgi:hypothetical protein